MTSEMPSDEVAAESAMDAAPGLSGPVQPLPTLTTTLTPDQVIQRLQALAKRGKLPDFKILDEGVSPTARRFQMLAFGSPYDRDLFGEARRESTTTAISFTSRLKRKFPIIVIVTMIVSLWPGVWLTDSMLSTYFSWYPRQFWVTCAWYLPLTLAAIPMLWKQYTKSERLTHAETLETIQKIAAAIDAK